jgi:hypothetical protein
VTLSKAEDWLAQVAAAEQNEETQEDSGPAEDTQASA